jgi:hypothetical protein
MNVNLSVFNRALKLRAHKSVPNNMGSCCGISIKNKCIIYKTVILFAFNICGNKESTVKKEEKLWIFGFWFFFIFFYYCCTGVQCDIYQSSYNIS